MFKPDKELQGGDRVVHEVHGAGAVASKEFVENPSDGDKTMYVVRMDDGETRNFKASELTAE